MRDCYWATLICWQRWLRMPFVKTHLLIGLYASQPQAEVKRKHYRLWVCFNELLLMLKVTSKSRTTLASTPMSTADGTR